MLPFEDCPMADHIRKNDEVIIERIEHLTGLVKANFDQHNRIIDDHEDRLREYEKRIRNAEGFQQTHTALAEQRNKDAKQKLGLWGLILTFVGIMMEFLIHVIFDTTTKK